MKKILLLFFLFPFLLRGHYIENWEKFLPYVYNSKAKINQWYFVGVTRGGYYIYFSITLKNDIASEEFSLVSPSGKSRFSKKDYEDFIFDGEKFYYSTKNSEFKITGYGLSFKSKSPEILLKGAPSSSENIQILRINNSLVSFPFLNWRFYNYLKKGGIIFHFKWIMSFYLSGEKRFPLKFFASRTESYYFLSFFNKIRGVTLLNIAGKTFLFKRGFINTGKIATFAGNEAGKGLFLKFYFNFNNINNEGCRFLPVGYELTFHSPFIKIPGKGVVIWNCR